MAQPLPPNSYQPESESFKAYGRCIELEKAQGEDDGKFTPQMAGRVLGYMMLHAPTPQDHYDAQRKIMSCADNGGLRDLARLYAGHFFKLFRKAKLTAQEDPPSPNKPLFNETEEGIARLMEAAKKSNSAVEKLNLEGPEIDFGALFGFCNVEASEASQGIHLVENVMTMSFNAHELFDSLQLWFEATGTLDTYIVRAKYPDIVATMSPLIRQPVTFKTTNPLLRVPNPRYLLLHAICATVANLSGVLDYFETVLEGWEEVPVLASDGRSVDLLGLLLARKIIAAS